MATTRAARPRLGCGLETRGACSGAAEAEVEGWADRVTSQAHAKRYAKAPPPEAMVCKGAECEGAGCALVECAAARG